MSVPSVYVLDGLDRNKFAVVNIDVVGYSHKRFVYVGQGINFSTSCFETLFIQLPDLVI